VCRILLQKGLHVTKASVIIEFFVNASNWLKSGSLDAMGVLLDGLKVEPFSGSIRLGSGGSGTELKQFSEQFWDLKQGCQSFLGTTYHNEEKYTKQQHIIPNGHKIFQMDIKLPIPRPSKIHIPKVGFLYENIPSGNPDLEPILRLLNFQRLRCSSRLEKNHFHSKTPYAINSVVSFYKAGVVTRDRRIGSCA
jgi:hypothetical protein